jgi:phosphoglycolate phosphatase-like HAD superfamily hydrolase
MIISPYPVIMVDFDGVLFDTAEECFVVGYNAFLSLSDQEADSSLIFNPPAEARSFFLENRPLVGPAGEFFALFERMHQGQRLTREEINRVVTESHEKYRTFTEAFFNTRKLIRKHYPDEWIKMNPGFEDSIRGIKTLQHRYNLFISTTKDIDSVNYLFSKNGICLSDDHIFSRECGLSKKDTAKHLCKTEHCQGSDIWFIDDNLSYLNDLAEQGVNCCLAAWGYTSSEAIAQAICQNYRVYNKFSEFVLQISKEKP